MGDYVTMQSIKVKNKIMDPTVLAAVRDGNLNLQTLNMETSPIAYIYQQTYNYITYPQLPPRVDELLKPIEKKK
jgi:hypothetical protein